MPDPHIAPSKPSLPWRFSSSVVMGIVGGVSRSFLFGLSNTQVFGLEKFLEMLDKREHVENRDRGLLTVSNHVSV